jgi:fumarate reductase flavoprotein subunit
LQSQDTAKMKTGAMPGKRRLNDANQHFPTELRPFQKIETPAVLTNPDPFNILDRLVCLVLTRSIYETTSAIYVNAGGERIINENLDFVSIKLKTMEQPERMIYLFMDQAAFTAWRNAAPPLISQADIDRFVARNGGVPMFANAGTIEETARIAGVDPARLRATADRFNGFVRAGQDADFGRTQLYPIGEGPYYLVEQKLRFASTLGGLKINEAMQVLRANDSPVAGLYAAGEIVGGVQGKESMPGCNVGWALTSGRLAGLSVAGK